MMTERDRINSINYARQEGEQKGLRKGREEGLEEGERKGELKKQREIASALKGKGVDAGMIAACTGLSLDEVAKL
jgi:predicted transposase/invertase (TIGR01784 family)